MSATNSKRELWVDYIKAIACLSVLTFHVIYGLQNAGLECYPVLAVIKDFCTIFQIPTFMIASGYLFSKKPIGNYFKFEARKLLNLGVPFVVFTSVYYFINSAAGSMVNFQSDRKSLIDCLILTPIAQYWYIFATIIIFIFLPIVEKVFKNEGIILLILLSWKLVNWYQISFCGYDYYFAQYAFYFYIGKKIKIIIVAKMYQ
ncbi:MAG: acyltransferase family protein, partial [Lachnospiraceae bacterium]|nr:acyltransferase family protein [Lachnospiraceae bacterium]